VWFVSPNLSQKAKQMLTNAAQLAYPRLSGVWIACAIGRKTLGIIRKE
jgi:hypothetical protein